MNRRIRIASTVFAVLALAVFAGTAVQAGKDEPVEKDVSLTIVGMTCGDCCTKVETAVNELEGVVGSKADYKAGTATVTYVEGEVTVEQIVAAVNENTSFRASVKKPKT